MKKDKFMIFDRSAPDMKTEIEGKVFEYKNIKFAFTKDEKADLEFYHLKSGFGFNGNLMSNYTNFMDSFNCCVKRVGGEEKFLEVAGSHPSLDETIEKENPPKFKHVPSKEQRMFLPNTYANLFQNTFWEPPKKYGDRLLSIYYGRYILDLIKFDKMLHSKFEYEEDKHGSMNDFIEKTWGKEVLEMVHYLAGI